MKKRITIIRSKFGEFHMENYFFETEQALPSKKIYLLVIYDIISNKRRLKFAKHMEAYGIRVQKSCFEAFLTDNQYERILYSVPELIDEAEDSVRVYRMIGSGEVSVFGVNAAPKAEDVIIL